LRSRLSAAKARREGGGGEERQAGRRRGKGRRSRGGSRASARAARQAARVSARVHALALAAPVWGRRGVSDRALRRGARNDRAAFHAVHDRPRAPERPTRFGGAAAATARGGGGLPRRDRRLEA